MRAVVYPFHVAVFPDKDEVKRLCRIAQGADTCIFLVAGPSGFECHGLNKMPIMSVIDRAERGETNARRMGCDEVLTFNPLGGDMGEVEIPV